MTEQAALAEKMVEAIRNQDLKQARQLIDDGVDVRQRDGWGDTLLHQCAVFDQGDIAKELVFHRADPNAQNHMGMTPLMVVRCSPALRPRQTA
jgi:ankyrin repeat protein